MSVALQVEQDAVITAEELAKNLADPMWRLSTLYKIIVKTQQKNGEGEDTQVITFKPNRAQRRFLKRLWNRNIILKARQLGFTTLICLAWLDHALFNANQRCGIIAQGREQSEAIFRDKVKFAYDNLPEALRAAMPLARDSAAELLFAHNNSSVKVGTSLRSGTYHRLLISEFGKICADSPKKAAEVMTGSIPTVPMEGGVLVIESTAEGQSGEFYDLTQGALALDQRKKKLNARDYRIHFFPWWQEPTYTMDAEGVALTEQDHEYFDLIEAAAETTLTIEQRAWYVATRDTDFATNPERMWQEYPSTPEEAFQKSKEGTYYAKQLTAALKQNRITHVPHMEGVPVNTFWDIGHSDGCAIWFHQRIGMRDHWIKFIEGWGESYSYFVAEMQKTGWVWGRHYLPHDGAHVRQGELENLSPKQMLEKLGLRNVEIVPVVSELQHGIQKVRDNFPNYWFDEAGCKKGVAHLTEYRKAWNMRTQNWTNAPLKDVHTEAADAIRQHAQGFNAVQTQVQKRTKSNWRTS